MPYEIQNIDITKLVPYENNARIHSKRQISQIARSIKDFGFNNPILVDGHWKVIAGHGRLLAAKEIGLTHAPVIVLDHMSEAEKKAYILADNKLAEKAGWDRDILKIELEQLIALDLDFDLTLTGFDTPEIDLVLNNDAVMNADPLDSPEDENSVEKRVAFGDLWQLGRHRVYCGDSLQPSSFEALLGEKRADLIFTDPPYNVPVDGHVCGLGAATHTDFAYASGEMSKAQFTEFLRTTLELMATFSKGGSLHYVCMDWRHIGELKTAGTAVYHELKNICVWNKQLGGMGSLYRSQHEFVFVFKHGDAPHINNIELGKHGRYRTNVWDYPGIHAVNNHREELKFHPTVKPVRMIADALLDASKQGAIVLDCFAGSGSTLLAAERTKRSAYVIEYEPKYCDVILHRFEKMTGIAPVLLQRGA